MKILMRKLILKTIIIKEFKQLSRDKRMRGVLIGSPILMLLIFGYAVNTDVKEIRMAVYDEDKSHLSRNLIERFTASRYFRLKRYLKSEKEISPLMDAGEAEIYLHFGKDFSRNIKSGNDTDFQVIIDGSDSNRASVINSYINDIVNMYSQEKLSHRIKLNIIRRNLQTADSESENQADNNEGGIRLRKSVVMKERVFFNPELSSRNFYLPGVIGLVVALIIIMLTSMSIVKERESGTIEQIIVSPMRSYEYIIGKTIPFAIVGLVDIIVISLLTMFWFKVPFNGNFIFLLVTGLLFTISTLALGLYISTVSRTQQQAMVSTFLVFLPSILLSGFIFPINSMPKAVQWITYVNPLRYYMAVLRGVFLKGVGIESLWHNVVPMMIIGLVILYLSARRFSRRLE